MKLILTFLFLLICVPVFAEEPSMPLAKSHAPAQLSNLTLANFFTEGWDQEWDKRATPGGAPDMSLLHVQTNFLEREFRSDFYNQQNVSTNKTGHTSFLDGLIAYGLNRRVMLEVVSNYQWNSARSGVDSTGAGGAFVGRVQLVDVPGFSSAYNFRVSEPNAGIGVKQTTVSNALAGWNDLTGLGLKRVGLYYSLQENTYVGAAKVGSKANDISYAAALAKTWTDPLVPLVGNFTTFVETYGSADLDGTANSRTLIVTPGIHTKLGHDSLGHEHVLMAGVDLPIVNPYPFNVTYRVTYVFDF